MIRLGKAPRNLKHHVGLRSELTNLLSPRINQPVPDIGFPDVIEHEGHLRTVPSKLQLTAQCLTQRSKLTPYFGSNLSADMDFGSMQKDGSCSVSISRLTPRIDRFSVSAIRSL
jgi:hypothetical protein